MRIETKLISTAALIAGLSTAAVAEVNKVVEPLPESAKSSQAAEAGEVNSVTTFTTEVPRADSNDSLSTQAGADTATAVTSTIDSGDIPASFASSSVAEATDIGNMQDSEGVNFAMINDSVIAWNDDEAVEMRSAILANTMVKDALDAEGYSEDDVVAAYTRADGGLTLVVDG